jgi:transposase
MQRKRHSKEFKVEAIALGEKIGFRAAAKDLGVSDSIIYTWRKLLAKDGHEAFPGNGKLKPVDEENRQLRLENKRLREERDILKKATLFFAKENQR